MTDFNLGCWKPLLKESEFSVWSLLSHFPYRADGPSVQGFRGLLGVNQRRRSVYIVAASVADAAYHADGAPAAGAAYHASGVPAVGAVRGALSRWSS